MPKVLLTAFAPYDDWPANASWLALQEVTRDTPPDLELVTRLYPVDFGEMACRLDKDLTADFDVALHLGQAPGRGRVDLEAVGINWGQERSQRAEEAWPLIEGGPAAYASTLPLADWAREMRKEGIPAEVSHHAGTYLCNAIFYLSQHLAVQRQLDVRVAFFHLPLDPSQIVEPRRDLASMPIETTAHGLRLVLRDIAASVPAR